MSKKILICDDAAFMRMMLKDILTRNSCTVVGEAGTGTDALKLYQQLQPDLVFMDITMPEMDGIQALKKIKKVDSNANVIMISALGQQEKVKEAIRSGAKGFIVKPFQPEQVVNVIKQVLG